MTINEAFQISDILRQASPSSQAEIASFAFIRRYERGQHVFFDQEEVNCFYILLEGIASLYKTNSLGEKKVIFIYGPGSLLNEVTMQELPASINCEIREEALVLVLPKVRFWYVLERDGALTRAVMESMSLKIRRLYRQLKNTTNALSGEKRLAAKLYKLAKDHGIAAGDEIEISMNLSITYLAEMVGSKRETVSRQMKKLTEMGLIRMEKNRVFVPDLKKLSKYFREP